MRIAQVSTSSGPVREDRTGSVESLVWLLTRELAAMGHEVTVFGCAGSHVDGELVVTHPGPYGESGALSDWQLCEWMTHCLAIAQSHRFDVIHSHAYLWGLPIERFSSVPMLHTMHTCPYEDEARLWDRFPDARISAVSAYQWSRCTARTPAAVVHHGIDPARFTFRERPEDYLCFLGRFTPGKGPLEAIEIARQLEIPLLMAGPGGDYFEAAVRPRIDGKLVRYLGPVDAQARDALLGSARALLYPLKEPEPFGLVQVEAMMCGTPVVGPRLGAIPEIVTDGLTGCIADHPSAMAAAVERALPLPRPPIRRHAESTFSARRMAEGYASLYSALAGPW